MNACDWSYSVDFTREYIVCSGWSQFEIERIFFEAIELVLCSDLSRKQTLKAQKKEGGIRLN